MAWALALVEAWVLALVQVQVEKNRDLNRHLHMLLPMGLDSALCHMERVELLRCKASLAGCLASWGTAARG